MKTPELLDHPKLRKFIKTLSSSSYLFREGEKGATMFILLEGRVELFAERDGRRSVIEIVEPGGFIGERAIITKEPYPRYLSAKSTEDGVVLEISAQDLEFLKITVPELMTELMTKAFETAAKRLRRMNLLAESLRPVDPEKRFINSVLFFAHAIGTLVPQGTVVPLSAEGINHYTGISVEEAREGLLRLETKKWIQKQGDGSYLVPSVDTLAKHATFSI